MAELNTQIVSWLRTPTGPRVVVRPVNADETVRRWRADRQRAATAAPTDGTASPTATGTTTAAPTDGTASPTATGITSAAPADATASAAATGAAPRVAGAATAPVADRPLAGRSRWWRLPWRRR